LKIDYADAIELISGKCFTTSVYDHLHTSEKSLRERAIYFDIIDGYTVSSNILYDFYASRPELPKPDAIITDGVDLQKFLPASGDKCRGPLSELVVGWVGNSAWGKSQGGDPKGYHRLFRPAIEILERRGVPVKVRLADAQAERIAFEQMPSFYRSIHVLACTSAAEGTPNPVLEAMACGVAVVSTDVGIVRDAFGPLQAQYILNDMTPDTLADALQRLSSDVDRYESLCAENVAAAAGWSWEEAVKGWWPFWIDAQRRSSDHRLSTRRREALIQACGSLNAYVQGIPRRRPRTRSWIEMITGRPAVRRRQS
jgi:glycosyltransferase involved in cell wall biosynthesis